MQTAVTSSMTQALAGQLLEPFRPTDLISTVLQTGPVPAGVALAKGTGDKQVKAPAASTDITTTAFIGIAAFRGVREPGSFATGEEITAVKTGTVAVIAAAGTYTKGAAVNVRYAGTGEKGSITAAAVSSETAVLPNAKIEQSVVLSAAGVVIIRVQAL
jgi:hypothetical protein